MIDEEVIQQGVSPSSCCLFAKNSHTTHSLVCLSVYSSSFIINNIIIVTLIKTRDTRTRGKNGDEPEDNSDEDVSCM